MKSNIFYKCKLFTFYNGNGVFLFKILGIGLSFKHILKYNFTKNEFTNFKGIFFLYWLVEFIK